jgi:hypothetical protein
MKPIAVSWCVMAALISGCSSTQYWVKPGTDLRTTAADLEACRLAANNGGQKVFTAQQLESPCMVSKGYELSSKPPSP